MSAKAPTKFVMFDFDGTLYDSHQAIIHSVTKTFDQLLPGHKLVDSDIQELVGSGMGLDDVLKKLHPDLALNDEDWIPTYREVYATHGQPLTVPFDGADRLLRLLKSQNIPIAIMSNKSVPAIITALANHGMSDIVPEKLIIGDGTPGFIRKPDTSIYYDVLLPILKDEGILEEADAMDVFMVGDTKADIQFAANIPNAKSVWCSFGHGDKASFGGLDPDFSIDSLSEIEKILELV